MNQEKPQIVFLKHDGEEDKIKLDNKRIMCYTNNRSINARKKKGCHSKEDN